jgi:serine/threonine protein phosphatase PrpC
MLSHEIQLEIKKNDTETQAIKDVQENESQEELVSPAPTMIRQISPIKTIPILNIMQKYASPTEGKKILDYLDKNPAAIKILESDSGKSKSPKLLKVVRNLVSLLDEGEYKRRSSISGFKDLVRLSAENKDKALTSQDKLRSAVLKLIEKDKMKKIGLALNEEKPPLRRAITKSRSLDDTGELSIPKYEIQSTDYLKVSHMGDLAAILCEVQGLRDEQQDDLQYCKIEENNKIYNAVEGIDQLSLEEAEEVLTGSIDTMEKICEDNKENIDIDDSGCTANSTVAFLKNGILHIYNVNVGDSISFYVILDKEGQLVESQLINTNLHKPTDPEEKKRIESAGGRVVQGRINCNINISRTLCDRYFEPFGLIHKPDFKYIPKELKPGQKAFIVTACDGLTERDYLDAKKIGEVLSTCKDNLNIVSRELISSAYRNGRGSHDNISTGVFEVTTTPQALAVFDGHGRDGQKVSAKVGKAFFPDVRASIGKKLYKQLEVTNSVPKQSSSLTLS